jgi:hypothetical protein
MFRFREDEATFFSGRRAVAKDEQGRDVLIGLTYEQTEFYIACLRRRHLPMPQRASVQRFFALHGKHEFQREARLAVPRRSSIASLDKPAP